MTGRHLPLRMALIVVLALCAAAWFFLVPERRQPVAAQAETLGEPNAAPLPTAETAAATAPLPASDAPLPLVFPSLKARADAGDRKAACRLGIELLRCQTLASHGSLTASLLHWREIEATKRGDLARADEMARASLHYLAVEESCAGLPPDAFELGARYLRQAALAGEPEAMLRYAAGQGFDSGRRMAYLRSPDFENWRREAPGMVEHALAEGRPEAAHLLWLAYADGQSMLSGLIPDDPMRAKAHRLLMERLWNPADPPTAVLLGAAPLSRSEELKAASLASDWHQRHFKGDRVDAEHALDGIAPFHDIHETGGKIRTDLVFCGDGAGTPHG